MCILICSEIGSDMDVSGSASHYSWMGVDRNRQIGPYSYMSKELQKFWELKDLSVKRLLSPKETYCEELFEAAHNRDDSGRYIVRLPAKEEMLPDLSESRNGAMRMFLNTEQRLGHNEVLRGAYVEFMRTYAELSHMKEIRETNTKIGYVIYHIMLWLRNQIWKEKYDWYLMLPFALRMSSHLMTYCYQV